MQPGDEDEVPDDLTCPITFSLMSDPVVRHVVLVARLHGALSVRGRTRKRSAVLAMPQAREKCQFSEDRPVCELSLIHI